jgi:hypothetical protein
LNAQRPLALAVAAGLLALLVGGCTYDYFQHTDRIGYRAGDAVNANLERETNNPSYGLMYDTSGLGKNGSVVPADPSTTTTTTTP